MISTSRELAQQSSGGPDISRRSRLVITVVLAVVTAALTGCGGHSLQLVSSSAARQRAKTVYRHWRFDALHFPPARFRSRPRLVANASDGRLARLAQRYGFKLVSFRYLARDRAASLIVQTFRSLPAFAADVSSIECALDPVWHGGLRYHAFFFEARDRDGVPFIATQHSVVNDRGQLEGEQWARGPALFPFPHG
jgi:hypothetical protein